MIVRRFPHVAKGRDTHLDAIVGHIRPADYEEILAMTGQDPDKMLARAWDNSIHRWAIMWQSKPIGLFGLSVMSLMGDVGVPWLIGRSEMEEIKYSFARQSIIFIRKMLKIYPILINYVDARNTLSIKWLNWLGFTVDPAMPCGAQMKPFHRFYMRRGDV